MGDHTEAIEVVYDPETIRYEDLLTVFWASHNPINEPWSRQYRSAIFPADDAQEQLATRSKAARSKAVHRPLYTAIEAGARFWTAEDYHQKYRLRSEPALMKALAERYPDGGWVDSTAAARINGMLAGHPYTGDIADLGLTPAGEKLLSKKR